MFADFHDVGATSALLQQARQLHGPWVSGHGSRRDAYLARRQRHPATPSRGAMLLGLVVAVLVMATMGCRELRDERAERRPMPVAVVEWEHGWHTPNVRATRYHNDVIGYNVGFRFPKHPNDCDRGEIVDFLEARGCVPYQMGGYPGAEILATCEDVIDKTTANAKLRAMLPELDALMGTL